MIEETIKWLSERPESERAGHRSTLFDALLFSVFSLGPEAREESAEQTSLRNKRIKQLQLIADELVQEEPLNEGYLGRLGVLYAELGDQEMASRAFATLGDLNGPFCTVGIFTGKLQLPPIWDNMLRLLYFCMMHKMRVAPSVFIFIETLHGFH